MAVGILALGLSAGMAVFTYVNAFFQPFPGVDADRLVPARRRARDKPSDKMAPSRPSRISLRRSP